MRQRLSSSQRIALDEGPVMSNDLTHRLTPSFVALTNCSSRSGIGVCPDAGGEERHQERAGGPGLVVGPLSLLAVLSKNEGLLVSIEYPDSK